MEREKGKRKEQKGEVTGQQRPCSTKARKLLLHYTNKGVEMQSRHGEQSSVTGQKKSITSKFHFWPDTKPNLD